MPFDKMPFDKMPFDKMLDKMIIRQNVQLTKYPIDKMSN